MFGREMAGLLCDLSTNRHVGYLIAQSRTVGIHTARANVK